MASAFQDYFAADTLAESLKIRKVEPRDCFAALAEGYDDVTRMAASRPSLSRALKANKFSRAASDFDRCHDAEERHGKP